MKLIALALAATAATPLTALPKPRFNTPAHVPRVNRVRFVLVSSKTTGPVVYEDFFGGPLYRGDRLLQEEPDYLYALERRNGHVLARLLLPNAAERIALHGRTLDVDTYDHHVVARLVGA